MKKISIISALALSALVYSCKKDKDSNEESMKKPADLIVGSWGWVSSKDHVIGWNGTPEKDTTYYSYGEKDSLIFEANGQVISRIPSQNYVDTNTYRFIADSTIVMWADTFKVTQISDVKLQMTAKDTVAGNLGGLRTTWYDFKK